MLHDVVTMMEHVARFGTTIYDDVYSVHDFDDRVDHELAALLCLISRPRPEDGIQWGDIEASRCCKHVKAHV